jgi:sugar/nucleoside kinase (ribokinase family)
MIEHPRGCFAGLCTVDLAYVVAEFPGPNQKVAATQQELTAGGPAANAAVTFSFLGGEASLITALGRHALSAIAWEDLEQQGVAVQDLTADPKNAPPLSSICVHAQTGDRTVVSANAAALSALPGKFDPETLAGMNILLVDGHHMPLCIAAARAARDRGITVVLDGGSWKAGMSDLLPLIDVAICSDDFADRDAPRNHGVPKVAITRGARPIVWSTPESAGEAPVPHIQPKDTSGAGDIFHGAFCWAYARGFEFTQSLEIAGNIATASCLSYGTRSWMNSIEVAFETKRK